MLVDADGSHAANNGTAVLVGDGSGSWREVTAPVQTPGVNNEGCRNFSPALLALDNTVLQISTDYDDGVCKPYYATGPIA